MKSPVDAVISDFSSPTAMSNFRIDEDGTLNKREGYYELGYFGESVRGAYAIEDTTYIVIGKSFFKLQNNEFTLIGDMPDCSFENDSERVSMFCNADIIYIIGGGEFYYYNISEGIFSLYPVYVPVVWKSVRSSGIGIENEPVNLISNHRKIQYNITSNVDYYFPESVESIVSVSIDDQLIPSHLYALEIKDTKNYIHFTEPDILSGMTSMVVEFVSNSQSAVLNRKCLSNINAFLYSDEEETKLFLYSKNTGGKIFVAVDRNGDSSPITPCLDFVPVSSYFSLIDGNCNIYKIFRYNNAIFAVTSNGVHQIQKRVVMDGTSTSSFLYSKILSSDFSTTEKSGLVIVDEICYSFSNDGLLALSYTEQDDIYSVKRIEIPKHMRPHRTTFPKIAMHYNKLWDELWCCYEDTVAVYNIRHKVWYRFTGIRSEFTFIYNSQTAISKKGTVYLFDESTYTDNSLGFEAVYESGIYDLDNIFRKKTIFGFGAVINNIYGATLVCTLKTDKDEECSITVTADRENNAKKYVQRVHARLGGCHYVTLRMVSPASCPPAHIKSIMFRYR